MFMSVKERARQIANGQLTSTTPIAPIVEPPPKAVRPETTPSKAATTKPSRTSKSASSRGAASPNPLTPLKKSQSSKSKASASAKPSPIGAFPETSPPSTPRPKLKRSKTEPAKTSTPRKSSRDKETPSQPKTSRTKSSKSATRSPPATPLRSSFFGRAALTRPSLTSTDDVSPKPSKHISPRAPATASESKSSQDPEIAELKAICLKQINGVAALRGKNLAVVCRQTSKTGQWYAALKDLGTDKYLKMWMNRDKTFATQKEALEIYVVFVRKMRDACGLFPLMLAR